MPLDYRMLFYEPDALLNFFAPLATDPWAMLLHSGQSQHPDSRFDIMVADPVATLVTRGDSTIITHNQTSTISSEDPLRLVKTAMRQAVAGVTPHQDIPFLGGAIGLFGYDLGRRFEHLPQVAAADLATPDMAVGIYDWALIADHQQRRLTLICHDDPDQRLNWITSRRACEHLPFRLTSDWHSNLSRQDYGSCFDQIQRWLHSGDCYQVNMAQRFSARYSGGLWQPFTSLLKINHAPFSAWLNLPESQIISVSPERFLRLREGEIQTRPIKGTLPRMADPDADRMQQQQLATSEKDHAENLMIVDLMRNDISRVAEPGSVSVPRLFEVETFPAVHHLVSTITATLKPTLHATDLLRACFPGGSITGAPKVRAMEIIDQLEPHRRNAWCGSIGYFSACGGMDSSITIRTLIAENQTLYCAAGGAIIADSTEQAEYQETLTKVGHILSALTELSHDKK